MTGVSKEYGGGLDPGTSGMMETTMMEGEEFYTPETAANADAAAGGDWPGKIPTSQLCRVCANPNEYLIPIFEGEGLEHELGTKIQKHLPIEVTESDTLPLHMCYNCASTLIAWNDMVVGCVEADKKLRQLQQEEENEEDYDDKAVFYDTPAIDSDTADDPIEPSTSAAPARGKRTVKEKKPRLRPPAKAAAASKSRLSSPPKAQEDASAGDSANERLQVVRSQGSHSDSDEVFSVWVQEADSREYFLCDIRAGNSTQSKARTALLARRLLAKCRRRSMAPPPAVCAFCDCAFREMGVLVTHLRHHTGFTPFFCKFCGGRYKMSSSLERHRASCECDEQKSGSGPAHPLTVVGSLFACVHCGKMYKLKSSLKEHLRAHKGKARCKQKCDVCGVKFLRKVDLAQHMSAHGTLHSCQECGKMCVSSRDLEDHRITHSTERPHTCLQCGASYKRKSHLTRHEQAHLLHPTRFHGPRAPRAAPGERFVCEFCGKERPNRRLLQLHRISHTGERNYECATCGRRFAQSGALSRHERTVHGGERNYSCETCLRTFTAKATKDSHMRIHTGEKPFRCNQCPKTFRTQQQLYLHDRTHSDMRPYACTHCNKRFRRRPHLVVHIRTHTGERPYACTQCNRAFAQRNDLTKHQQIHRKRM